MIFRARQFEFRFPRPTLVMGILNVTPDSFSDGGQYVDVAKACARAEEIISQGADIIDIGGESTRPGALVVSAEEEASRVLPVIRALAGRVKAPISIDTQKPEVAAAALEAGAVIVNDIAANRDDPAMWRVVARFEAGYVAMHMQGTPQTMQRAPVYHDPVAEVGDFFAGRIEHCAAAGIQVERLVLDPGIGFGKELRHNLALLAGLRQFHVLGRPMLVGASRKSFISKLGGVPPAERLPGSLACAVWAVREGAQLVRVHDVAETVQAVRVTEALMGDQSEQKTDGV